jgi:hypothetical protein
MRGTPRSRRPTRARAWAHCAGGSAGALAVVILIATTGCTWPGTLEVYVPETSSKARHRLDVGRELGLLVALRIPLDPDNGEYRTPENLGVHAEDEGGVTVEDLGHIGFGADAWATVDREGEGTLLRITPRRTGLGTIRFTADDTENEARFDWNAWDVARVDYVARLEQADSITMEAVVTRLTAFTGSRVDVRAQYAVGTIELHGDAPLQVSAGDPETRFSTTSSDDPTAPLALFLGSTPHTATVSSPAGGTTLMVEAVGIDAVSSIRLSADSTLLDPATSYRLARGRIVYLRPVPFDARGDRIQGSNDTEPEVTVTGSSVTVRDLISGPRIQLEAVELGTSMVEVTWGPATATAQIEVIDY